LGAHTIEVFASDAAGNPAYQSVSFRVVATIGSLIASVNIYALQGKIDASKLRGLLAIRIAALSLWIGFLTWAGGLQVLALK